MAGRILIIDDERWYFEPILDRLKYRRIPFDYYATGSAGLKALKENKYELVVLDMLIPLGGDLNHLEEKYKVAGIYVLEQIRKQDATLPVLCYTVLIDAQTKRKIGELGGEHIAKAEDPEILFGKIDSIIGLGSR